MKNFRVFLLIALFVTMMGPDSTCLSGSLPQASFDQPGPLPTATLEFPDVKDAKRQNRPVPLKVHFPTQGHGFPLVILSHGAGGDWDANIYQARHLAGHGYVVVCPEHVFSNTEKVKFYMSAAGGGLGFMAALQRMTTDPQAVIERPRDVAFAIDQAVEWNSTHPVLKWKINTTKTAVMGHSFGAYTTLAVCGAQPILDFLEPRVGPVRGLAGDLSDGRVTFGLAMSPQSPGTTFFGKDSYQTINRPLVCLTGSKDVQKSYDGRLMLPQRRQEVFNLLPAGSKYFIWLKNADHMGFSDSPKARVFPSPARPDAQRISKALMVLFSDYFLKDKKGLKQYLNQEYVNSLCGAVVTSAVWMEK